MKEFNEFDLDLTKRPYEVLTEEGIMNEAERDRGKIVSTTKCRPDQGAL